MNRSTRPAVQAGLWVAAAAGALLLGLTAVGSIGSGLGAAGEARPLAAEEIEARLARQPAPAPGTTEPEAPPPGGQAPVVVPAGPAGTVLARCEGGVPAVVSVNPAQGFERDDDPGPGRIAFDGDDVDVQVDLSCSGPTPSGRVTVLTDDD